MSPHTSPNAIAELGASPPVLFPVVTDGNEDIIATYRLFAPGATHDFRPKEGQYTSRLPTTGGKRLIRRIVSVTSCSWHPREASDINGRTK